MKHFCTLITGILMAGSLSSQSIGWKTAPQMQYSSGKAYFGISYGFYYDQTIYRWLGISTGLELGRHSTNKPSSFQEEFHYLPDYSSRLFQSIQIPAKITFNVSYPSMSTKFNMVFTTGYILGVIYEVDQYYTGFFTPYSTFEAQPIKPGKNNLIHSASIGLEARYNPQPKINLALGVEYQRPVFSHMNDVNMDVVCFYIKTGFNFRLRKSSEKE
ncbi:MAG TPA: hypothetical protein VG603_08745 [Chitinophagales bacterium]|nr:hypothetical protein [Chitinophagales bacterium]